MSSKYDIPCIIERTNHGGGLLMYLSCELAHKRILGLETFWNESLWVASSKGADEPVRMHKLVVDLYSTNVDAYLALITYEF